MRFGFFSKLCLRLLATGLVIASAPIEAALVTFTNRTAFEAATKGLTTVSFEGIVPTDSAESFPNPAGLTTANGLSFRTSGTGSFGTGFVTVYGADLAAEQSPVLNTGTGAILAWAPPGQPGTAFLDVFLPAGKTAFATNVWAQQPFVTTVRAIVNSGEATENFDIATWSRPTHSFFGVISDSNMILLVRFATPAGQVGLIIDDVGVGTANGGMNPIPEPGTMILLFTGLAGAAVFRRCRHT
jgi:hypothetical protein